MAVRSLLRASCSILSSLSNGILAETRAVVMSVFSCGVSVSWMGQGFRFCFGILIDEILGGMLALA